MTPEGAATAYLQAWGRADPLALCRLTTDIAERIVAETPEAERLCVDRISAHVNYVAKGMAPLKTASVGAVTTQADGLAVPDLTTVTPEAARQVAEKMTLVRIRGKWFVRTPA